jgi:hypothetical protein
VGVNNGTFTMKGGTISGNTAATSGGGVGVGNGTFIKTGGSIIYGGETSTADSLKNIVGTRGTNGNIISTTDDMGHAAYVSGTRKRETTADTGDNLDSTKDKADGGGWE